MLHVKRDYPDQGTGDVAAGPQQPAISATPPYRADGMGVLRVVLPDRCVHAQPGEACSLFVHHYRDRKTGPQYPGAVVGRREHAVGCYTLYPPGHVPHGRQSVVSCRASGQLILDEVGHPPWRETVFAAAVDAAEGVWWPAVSLTEDACGRRRTQGRQLGRAGRLLGLHLDTASRTTGRVATRLGVPTLVLRTAARDWSPGWRGQGGAIATVLEALPLDGRLADIRRQPRANNTRLGDALQALEKNKLVIRGPSGWVLPQQDLQLDLLSLPVPPFPT